MEGPRAVRQSEFESLRALTSTVFGADLVQSYPQLFNADNADNLRVCVDDGQCVSHVGMKVNGASLFGCQIKVGCIGAVSTFPEYRGQGLASACFDDAVNKAYHDGVDIMIVSGDRDLYRRRGCLNVGRDSRFTVSAQELAGFTARDITVEVMKDEELPLVMECYRGEPVRFLRPLDDYRYALQCGVMMGKPSDILVVRDGDLFLGYVIMQRPRDNGVAQVVEFAGDRGILLAALPEIVRRYALNELRWQVQRHDRIFHALCSGLPATPISAPGTVKLINFPQLMARLQPRFEELLGRRAAARLAFRQDDQRYSFRCGGDELVADRDTATRLLFGTVDGQEALMLEGHGDLTEVLKAILPLPCLWYGINYV